MKNYEEKARLLISYYKNCPVCGKPSSMLLYTAHHLMHNKDGNRKKYPHALDSLYNLMPIHPACIGADNRFSRSDGEMSRYEILLIAFRAVMNDGTADAELILTDLRREYKEMLLEKY